MNTDWKSLRYRIRTTSLVGVSVYMLGAGIASTTAYTPNPNRDVRNDFATAADTRTPTPCLPPTLPRMKPSPTRPKFAITSSLWMTPREWCI